MHQPQVVVNAVGGSMPAAGRMTNPPADDLDRQLELQDPCPRRWAPKRSGPSVVRVMKRLARRFERAQGNSVVIRRKSITDLAWFLTLLDKALPATRLGEQNNLVFERCVFPKEECLWLNSHYTLEFRKCRFPELAMFAQQAGVARVKL